MFNKKRFTLGARRTFWSEKSASVLRALGEAFDYTISLAVLMTITTVLFLAVLFVIGFIWACIQTARVIGACDDAGELL